MSDSKPIFLLTDFGASSYYQGVMKGVIASQAPAACVHDLSHAIASGSVKEASFVAKVSLDYLPENAILVIVVDPGVGSDRRILAASFGNRLVVAPDNGVLSSLHKRDDSGDVRVVTHPDLRLADVSTTFHGRDIFAPTAARLSAGMPFDQVGDIVPDLRDLSGVEEQKPALLLSAEVVHVDSFGNLITDVSRDRWIRSVGTPQFIIDAGKFEIGRISPTYGAVRPGEPVAYFGSSGYLEIGIRDGVAATAMKLDVGQTIAIRKR